MALLSAASSHSNKLPRNRHDELNPFGIDTASCINVAKHVTVCIHSNQIGRFYKQKTKLSDLIHVKNFVREW